ncbi:MAG TPA: hypothetical protein VK211_11350 [Kamptonema sp.]|nr:hypothetical protein [Kamptonema sp.]
MKTKTRNDSKESLLEPNQIDSINSSDFDSWAKAVKRQMIAALSKKGAIERP